MRRFGLKTGIHFAHFGEESGMAFEGTTEYMNVSIVSIPNDDMSKKEREICEFEIDFKKSFMLLL